MVTTAGALRAAAQRRVRDTDGTAHSDTIVLDLLSHCQRAVNAKNKSVLGTTTKTLLRNQPLIHIQSSLNDNILRIERVQYQGRDLERVQWTSLAHHNPRWFRLTDRIPRVWDVIGRDLFLVWPSPPIGVTVTVDVTYTKSTVDLTTDGDSLEVDEQHSPAILTLMEQLLLMRQRLLPAIASAAQRTNTDVEQGRAV